MRMRLFTINSNVTIDQPADTKSHTLHFRPVVPAGGMGPGMGATSSLVLALTQQEAGSYTLGGMYDVDATLAASQQPTADEVVLDQE